MPVPITKRRPSGTDVCVSGNISTMNSGCEEGWESREAFHGGHLRSSRCSQEDHRPQASTANRHYCGVSQTESDT